MKEQPTLPTNAIAVIGMAGRFPGAPTIEDYWRNLCDGIESIDRFGEDELEDAFGPEVRGARGFVKARPILPDTDMFDADFFGMYPREAALTDPQQRVFLEIAWEALEDGGYDPATCGVPVGVFAGASMNTYFMNNVCGSRAALNEFTSSYQVGCYPTLVGACGDFLATRVSYKLDLRGPSFTVQTACSTSLTAIAQASQSLLLFQCDMALAGGVSITYPQKRGYLSQEGGMVSEDGHCRTFDARANGTVFGSGAGVVLLKRLEDAIADGDHIYAVVLGCGINNDGAGKVGFTAPSSEGQAGAITMAHAAAAIDPASIRYVECHGTATPLGDPIEIAGLKRAFRAGGGPETPNTCALGSVKSNVGHLDAAAGVAGFIKTALALERGILPATLHFETPNPRLGIEDSPFFVNAALSTWPEGPGPRRAGVSAFGVGGTNVHVVLEERPSPLGGRTSARPPLLTLSARSPAALAQMRTRLARHLADHPTHSLPDAAFTLQVGRRAFEHRWSAVSHNVASAISVLDAPAAKFHRARPNPPVAFLFPGQGSQHADMARGLYDHEPSFRDDVDRCAAILQPYLGEDLRTYIYPAEPSEDDRVALSNTRIAQPAIFTVEYALARLWMRWGVRPQSMIGHSVGEFVAACLAGVFGLEDALALVAVRGRMMQELPAGCMLSVRLSEAELEPLLDPGATIAAVNAPGSCVAAGPDEAIRALEAVLDGKGVPHRRLRTSHAFHSAMMDPVIEPFSRRVRDIDLRAPEIPYVSSVTGTWMIDELACSPDYWAGHLRKTVRFADGITALVRAGGDPVLLEVGPGSALTSLALQGAARGMTAISSLPDATRERPDQDCVVGALGRLWAAGVQPDWTAFHDRPLRRVSLPTYPFERERHWIELPARSAAAVPVSPASAVVPRANELLPQPTPTLLEPISMPEATGTAGATALHDLEVRGRITALLEDLSGQDVAGADPQTTFLEMGFDSLFLTQVSQGLQNAFGLKVTFRQLLGDLNTVPSLAAYVVSQCPLGEPAGAAAPHTMPAASVPARVVAVPSAATGAIEAVMREQMRVMTELMQHQLAALAGTATSAMPMPLPQPAPPQAAVTTVYASGEPEEGEVQSRFRVYKPAQGAPAAALGERERRHIDALAARYGEHMRGSKRMTSDHRPVLADPRAVSGFSTDWKEMVFPVVAARSKGSRIWDVDGNSYIDLVNGYGQTMFGHAPDFVVDAVREQLEAGFAIGPQSALTGEVAALFCEMTGNERVTFCNTGSEAVMAAMRVARTVTGRSRVVMFSGDYHGQFDEVLVRGVSRNGQHRTLPIAPGIPDASVENVTVLDYGSREALAWIRAHASELAAVLVETVQSRRPELRPREFLAELRAITEGAGTALVFDEVVTGFRMHPGGMQAVFGIQADLATYGKVVGGGMPVGILAGARRFMDALDGGQWCFGDNSYPEVGVTFFAGTFVRHPLTLAAVRAVLRHLRAAGPVLQETLTARTAGLVQALRGEFEARGLSIPIETYGSLFYFSAGHDDRLGSLLYFHLRARGVYIQDGFPCFLTTAHSDSDLAAVVQAFRESLDALQVDGILAGSGHDRAAPAKTAIPAPEMAAAVQPTPSQTEVWLSAQLSDEASCAFNESISMRLVGSLDVAGLEAALNGVVARHDALRSHFDRTGILVHFAPELVLRLPVTDLSRDGEPDGALRARIAADSLTPFDLVAGPLIRAQLLRLASDCHVLLITAHHIVCDGWSMNVLVDEIAAIYRARSAGVAAALGPVMPFADYARLQQAHPSAARDESYWLGIYAAAPPALQLPTDRPRPVFKTFRGSTAVATVYKGLTASLKALGARHGCTLFVTLLSAFEALMGRLTGQTDLVVAIPSARQSLLEDERILVGHCVNLLPLHAAWDDEATFSTLMTTTRQSVLDAYDHSTCTLGTLLQAIHLPRDPSRLPLAEVQFNLERFAGDIDLPGLETAVTPNPKSASTFDLFFNVIESRGSLRIDCDYNADLFDAATIDRWLGHYVALLSAAVTDAGQKVGLLPIAGDHAGLASASGLELQLAEDERLLTVNGLFEAQAARTPDACAVFFGAEVLTYRDLDQRAERVASRLRDVPTGSRIAVLLDRSPALPIALLGVMKAGCAYVPLATNQPRARIESILAEADVAALVTTSEHAVALAAVAPRIVNLDQDRTPLLVSGEQGGYASRGDDTAYVIFTSGSTGKPKGVEVAHRSVANFLASMRHQPGLKASDRLLAVTTPSFDIAALELFLPLVVGAAVDIASQAETSDGAALLHHLRSSGVTALQATPITWRMLLEVGFLSSPGLKMLCGGEALPRDLADHLLEGGGELWNMYGPTETTIWSSVSRIFPGCAPITVGTPIANTQFHVLDRFDRPVSLGVVGQLHIGGAGVARGYFRRPDLTDDKFIPDRIGRVPGQRLYRTGDLARMLPDGTLQLLGRTDHQVKLRGFRIELGEIEAALAKAGARVNAVVLREDVPGEPRLVAYFEAPADGIRPEELRAVLAGQLPDYMIPSLWVRMDAIPFGPSRKVDRRALPQPDMAQQVGPAARAEPRTVTERILAQVCAEVLHVPNIGIDEDLLMLGTDSIHLFQIVAHASQAGLNVSAKDLLQGRTIAKAAAAASLTERAVGPAPLPTLVRVSREARRVKAGVV